MGSAMDVRKAVEEAVKEFNERFSAECEVLEAKEDEIKILFKGHICFTCGAYDYFEDMAFSISERLGREYVVENYHQLEDGSYVVTIKPAELVQERKREFVVMIFDKEGKKEEFRLTVK
ncbi:hypothetical protein IPA_01980 [Ignicoccus pacificus DSM 13166]|uniref:Uncharacterized protein n=1 Tax=Ignicoccus pacificus DSM 13166 TaxID=940294 RepID=A0A977KA58_9CREN|nr:hypothetical protein IPA_01980 [Ignicoccus pacificus DSM 13166]